MSISLDCRDGQHRACHESGRCAHCECHDIMPHEWMADLAREPSARPQTQATREELWASQEVSRILAQLIDQPRGIRALMSDPAARVQVSASVGLVLGMSITTIAYVVAAVTR